MSQLIRESRVGSPEPLAILFLAHLTVAGAAISQFQFCMRMDTGTQTAGTLIDKPAPGQNDQVGMLLHYVRCETALTGGDEKQTIRLGLK